MRRKLILTAAILAGGESRRMGTDKTLLEIGGVTLLELAARTAQSSGLTPLVVGRDRPQNWPLAEVLFLPDLLPGRGPLGGLETALRHTGSPVLALACDLPLLTAEALCWLAAQAEEERGEHGLAVLNEGKWEPLFSIYKPSCLPLLETRLTAGRLSLHGLIESGNFSCLEAPDWVRAQLVNVNTPEDLARL